MNTLDILKQLVSIPSYVDNRGDDSVVANWIFNFLKKAGIQTEKQFVTDRRMNILAYSSFNPELVVAGHLDTVRPLEKWPEATTPIEKNGKLYGLGAGDMKAGLAVMLSTLISKKPKNAMFLFYCDEEYDFLGMKKFVKNYKNVIKPKFIVSMDGENLQIGNACRGLIEVTMTIRGKSGHSGNPNSGVNAITKSVVALNKLERLVKMFKTKELGCSTINVASVNGGTLLNGNGKIPTLSREGNVIPDFCEVVLEVRPADPRLDALIVVNKIKKLFREQKLVLERVKVRHNLGSWLTPREQLDDVLRIVSNKTLADPMEAGYTDAQMLWGAFGKVPTCSFGPAEPNVAHTANEFVRISSLQPAQTFLMKLLNNAAKT